MMTGLISGIKRVMPGCIRDEREDEEYDVVQI
jgi:hypothetical protein